jgi:hypothetical protein
MVWIMTLEASFCLSITVTPVSLAYFSHLRAPVSSENYQRSWLSLCARVEFPKIVAYEGNRTVRTQSTVEDYKRSDWVKILCRAGTIGRASHWARAEASTVAADTQIHKTADMCHSAAGRISSIDLIGSRTCDILTCSTVRQPTALPHTVYKTSLCCVIIRQWRRFYFQHKVGTKIAVLGICSARLPARGMRYSVNVLDTWQS